MSNVEFYGQKICIANSSEVIPLSCSGMARLILIILKCSSFTANTKQLYSCHPPWFKDTPYWPSNRQSSSDGPTCDSTQAQAKWTAPIWRRLAAARWSQCTSPPTRYNNHRVFQSVLYSTVQINFVCVSFFIFPPETREQRAEAERT